MKKISSLDKVLAFILLISLIFFIGFRLINTNSIVLAYIPPITDSYPSLSKKTQTKSTNPNKIAAYFDSFRFKDGPVTGDSWMAMVGALDHIDSGSKTPVYESLFKNKIKFQYPLSSLLIFSIPHKLTGTSYSYITYCLNIMCLLSIPLFSIICTLILNNNLESNGLQNYIPKQKFEIALRYSLVFLLICLFYPIIYSFKLGQIQTILTLLTAVIILLWQKEKKILAGIILGIICVIKPQLAIIFFWAAIRKQWSVLIYGGVASSVLLLLSFKIYGFEENLHYLNILSFLSHHGEAYYQNQSINGLINRMLFNGKNLTWDGTFPPYLQPIYIITLISSLLLMLLGLFWNYKSKKPSVTDLCIIILSTTIASPIAWTHHYAILFPIFLILLPYFLKSYYKHRWISFSLILVYILISQKIAFLNFTANTSYNFLQSSVLFGAMFTLYVLLLVSARISKSKELNQ